MKKFTSALFALFMVLSIAPVTFASDESENLLPEIQQFYMEVEEHNRIVEQKWQEALAQSAREKEEYEALLASMSPIQPKSYRSAKVLANVSVAPLAIASIYQTAIYNTSISNGNEIITSVSSTGATKKSSRDSVSNYSSQRTIIDLGRTLAVNCSMTAGRQANDGTWYYKPISLYVEFYYNGSANVY